MRKHNGRYCTCGGKLRQYDAKVRKDGVKRATFHCMDCPNKLVEYVGPDGQPYVEPRSQLQGKGLHQDRPETLVLETPLCPWFSTLPVAGCVSLR